MSKYKKRNDSHHYALQSLRDNLLEIDVRRV